MDSLDWSLAKLQPCINTLTKVWDYVENLLGKFKDHHLWKDFNLLISIKYLVPKIVWKKVQFISFIWKPLTNKIIKDSDLKDIKIKVSLANIFRSQLLIKMVEKDAQDFILLFGVWDLKIFSSCKRTSLLQQDSHSNNKKESKLYQWLQLNLI